MNKHKKKKVLKKISFKILKYKKEIKLSGV